MLGGFDKRGFMAKATEYIFPESFGCQPIVKALFAILALLAMVGGCTLLFSE